MTTTEVLVTVPDRGAADLLVQLLAEHDISAEIQRVPGNPYLGMLTADAWEVRVASEDLQAAQAVTKSTESDSATEDEQPSDSPRAPSLITLLGLSIVVPLPVGMLHAQYLRLGFLLLGVAVPCGIVGIVQRNESLFAIALIAKLLDTVVSPWLLVRTRRRLGVHIAGDGWKGIGLSLLFATLSCAALAWWNQQREELKQEPIIIQELDRQLRNTQQSVQAGTLLKPSYQFPKTALGRIATATLDYNHRYIEQTQQMNDSYYKLEPALGALVTSGAGKESLEQFVRDAEKLRLLAERLESEKEWDELCDALHADEEKTQSTKAFVDGLQRGHTGPTSSVPKAREIAGKIALSAAHLKDAATILLHWQQVTPYELHEGHISFPAAQPTETEQDKYGELLRNAANLANEIEQLRAEVGQLTRMKGQ